MPRYFFHVHDGTSVRDLEGTELPDINAAKRDAVRLAAGVLNDNPEQFWNGEDWSIDVCDAHGLLLFTLNFTAAMAPAIRDGRQSQ